MQPTRFQLEGTSLDELRERVLEDYGPEARIVSAERVTVGGIGGFLSRRHIEAVVEVADADELAGSLADPDSDPLQAPEHAVLSDANAVPADAGRAAPVAANDGSEALKRPRGRRAADPAQPLPNRAGLLALLSEADGQEAQLHGRQEPGVSTESDDFDRLMDGLTFGAQPSRGARAATVDGAGPTLPAGLPKRPGHPAEPMPLRSAGDLVVVVGLGPGAVRAASVLAGPGTRIHPAGQDSPSLTGDGAAEAQAAPRIHNRIGLVQARASGVGAGEPVFVAYALDHAVDLETQVQEVDAMRPDQLWVAVDAGRKSDDTRAWVETLDSVCPIDAVAVYGSGTTATPETVRDLGIPLRDIDERPLAPAGPRPRTTR